MRAPNRRLALSTLSVLYAFSSVTSSVVSTESVVEADNDESIKELNLSRTSREKGSDGSGRLLFDSSFNNVHEISGGLDGSHMENMFSPRGSSLERRRRRRRLVQRHRDDIGKEIVEEFEGNEMKDRNQHAALPLHNSHLISENNQSPMSAKSLSSNEKTTRELTINEVSPDAPCIPQDGSSTNGILIYQPPSGCIQGVWDITSCACKCFAGWCHHPASNHFTGSAGDGINPPICSIPCELNIENDDGTVTVLNLCGDGGDCIGSSGITRNPTEYPTQMPTLSHVPLDSGGGGGGFGSDHGTEDPTYFPTEIPTLSAVPLGPTGTGSATESPSLTWIPIMFEPTPEPTESPSLTAIPVIGDDSGAGGGISSKASKYSSTSSPIAGSGASSPTPGSKASKYATAQPSTSGTTGGGASPTSVDEPSPPSPGSKASKYATTEPSGGTLEGSNSHSSGDEPSSPTLGSKALKYATAEPSASGITGGGNVTSSPTKNGGSKASKPTTSPLAGSGGSGTKTPSTSTLGNTSSPTKSTTGSKASKPTVSPTLGSGGSTTKKTPTSGLAGTISPTKSSTGSKASKPTVSPTFGSEISSTKSPSSSGLDGTSKPTKTNTGSKSSKPTASPTFGSGVSTTKSPSTSGLGGTSKPTKSSTGSKSSKPTVSPTFGSGGSSTKSPSISSLGATSSPTKTNTGSKASKPTVSPTFGSGISSTKSPSTSGLGGTSKPTKSNTGSKSSKPTASPTFGSGVSTTKSPSISGHGVTSSPTKTNTGSKSSKPTVSPTFGSGVSTTKSPSTSGLEGTSKPTKSNTGSKSSKPTTSPIFGPGVSSTKSPSTSGHGVTSSPTKTNIGSKSSKPTASPTLESGVSTTKSPSISGLGGTSSPTKNGGSKSSKATVSPTFGSGVSMTKSPSTSGHGVTSSPTKNGGSKSSKPTASPTFGPGGSTTKSPSTSGHGATLSPTKSKSGSKSSKPTVSPTLGSGGSTTESPSASGLGGTSSPTKGGGSKSSKASLSPSAADANTNYSKIPSTLPSVSFKPSLPTYDSSSGVPSSWPSRESLLPSFTPTSLLGDDTGKLPTYIPTSRPSFSHSPSQLSFHSQSGVPSVTNSQFLSIQPSLKPSVSVMPSEIPSSKPSLCTDPEPDGGCDRGEWNTNTCNCDCDPGMCRNGIGVCSLPCDATSTPSTKPSISEQPSLYSSTRPSSAPIILDSNEPSDQPSSSPSVSLFPSQRQSPSPSASSIPSSQPSYRPSIVPSLMDSHLPSTQASLKPSVSVLPSEIPSSKPSLCTDPEPDGGCDRGEWNTNTCNCDCDPEICIDEKGVCTLSCNDTITPQSLPSDSPSASSAPTSIIQFSGPVATDDQFDITADSVNNILDVLQNDIRGDPDLPLSIQYITPGGANPIVEQSFGNIQTLNGIITIAQDRKSLTYTPNEGFVGNDGFSYHICDTRGPLFCDTAYVVVTVVENLTSGTDSPSDSSYPSLSPSLPNPSASNDMFQIEADSTRVFLNVLSNDSSADPDRPLTILQVTDAAGGDTLIQLPNDSIVTMNGIVEINEGNSSLTYSPNEGFIGVDEFGYIACDYRGEPFCDNAKVTINIVNGPMPSSNPTKSMTPSPPPSFPNPIALDDLIQVSSGTVDGPLRVLENDIKADQSLPMQIFDVTTAPSGSPVVPLTNRFYQSLNGIVEIAENRMFLMYTPNDEFIGDDMFAYITCDSRGDPSCVSAVVTVRVTNQLSPSTTPSMSKTPSASPSFPEPTANDDNYFIHVDSVNITLAVLENDIAVDPSLTLFIKGIKNDIDGMPLMTTTGVPHQTPKGIVFIDDGKSLIYTPEAGFVGGDVFGYVACDSRGQLFCDEAVVIVSIVEHMPSSNPSISTSPSSSPSNQRPTAIDDEFIVYNNNENSNLNVLQNDINAEPSRPLSIINITDAVGEEIFSPTSGTSYGTLNGFVEIIDGGSILIYTPNAGFVGYDAFGYVACDFRGLPFCDTAIVTVKVVENPMPSTSPSISVSPSSTPSASDPIANDDDIDVPVDSTDVSLNVLHNDISASPTLPLAIIDITDGTPDSPILPSNDGSFETPNGVVKISSDGKSLIYTPDEGFVGDDIFGYVTCDSRGDAFCDHAVVTVSVVEHLRPSSSPSTSISPSSTPSFPGPIANDDFINIPVDSEYIPLNVLQNDIIPNSNLSLTITSIIDINGIPISLNSDGKFETPNGVVSLSVDGTSLTYTPNPGFVGDDSFGYLACDIRGDSFCDGANVTVSVSEGLRPSSTPSISSSPSIRPSFSNPFATADLFLVPPDIVDFPLDVLGNDFAVDPSLPIIITDVTLGPGGTPVTELESGAFQTTNGIIRIAPDGLSLLYTPNTGFIGGDTCGYVICDSRGAPFCDSDFVFITVVDHLRPSSTPSVSSRPSDSDVDASDDVIEVPANSVNNTIPVLDNDNIGRNGVVIIVSGQSLSQPAANRVGSMRSFTSTTQSMTPTQTGTCRLAEDGTSVSYTPPKGFTGMDACTYKVCDSRGEPYCDIAEISIRVTDSNPPHTIDLGDDKSSENSYSSLLPSAADDQIHVPVNSVKNIIPVLDNDMQSDPSHPLHVVSIGFNLTHGSDRTLQQVTEITGQASNGVCEISPDGTAIFYTPNPGFVGTDQCDYRACDERGPPYCADATVYILVSEVPTALPSSQPSVSPVVSCPSSIVWWIDSISCLSGESPPTNAITYCSIEECCDALYDEPAGYNFCILQTPQPTKLPTNTPTNAPTQTPTSTLLTVPSLPPTQAPTFRPTSNPTNPVTNTPTMASNPIAVDDMVEVPVNSPGFAVSVLQNDILGNPSSALYVSELIASTPPVVGTPIGTTLNGLCEISADGFTVNYTPNPGFIGVDTCTYRVCDQRGEPFCDNASISITVTSSANSSGAATNQPTPMPTNPPTMKPTITNGVIVQQEFNVCFPESHCTFITNNLDASLALIEDAFLSVVLSNICSTNSCSSSDAIFTVTSVCQSYEPQTGTDCIEFLLTLPVSTTPQANIIIGMLQYAFSISLQPFQLTIQANAYGLLSPLSSLLIQLLTITNSWVLDPMNQYYPDWGRSNTCVLNNGDAPAYILMNPSMYFFSTIEECCTQFYPGNYDACIDPDQLGPCPGGGSSSGGSPSNYEFNGWDQTFQDGTWYPDWEGGRRCVNDGNEPNYMRNWPSAWMFRLKIDCCWQHFQWELDECMGNVGGSTNNPCRR